MRITAPSRWLASLLPVLVACSNTGTRPAPQGPENLDCSAVLPSTPTDLVWPKGQDKARIAYVGTLRGNVGCPNGGGLTADTQRLEMYYPRVAIPDDNGEVLVAGRGGALRFDGKGGVTPYALTDGVVNPRGMAFNDGKVLMVDSDRRAVRVYNRANEPVATIGEGDMERPHGLAVDRNRGRIYVTDAGTGLVQVYGLDGQRVMTLGSSDNTSDSALAMPVAVAVNSVGNVYVVHNGQKKVSVFAPDGTLVTRFGEQGIWQGQLQRPKGIAIDSEDHVYVTDSTFDNMQIFDPAGHLLLVVGETGGLAGQFNVPSMITIDAQDRIFVTDFGFHRVQVFQYLRDQ